MRYFGSKVSALESIYDLISQRMPAGSFCDPFGGIGTVGSYFKEKGYKVWTGDILTAAHYFQVARVQLNRSPSFKSLRKELGISSNEELVEFLNNAEPRNGWITKQFSENRQYFIRENARRIDACRLHIAQWSRDGWLSTNECALLLASLINSVDKVANTAGTYYAYLKSWYRKALKPFRFELIPPTRGRSECHCFLGEANDLVAERFFDILYLDPPYNERCYTSYYHLPESLALRQSPRATGLSGVPSTLRSTSKFNKAQQAGKALSEMLGKARFRLLVFHYSDSGLIPPDEVRDILKPHGHVEEFIIDSKGYTTAEGPRTVKHRLYLIDNG